MSKASDGRVLVCRCAQAGLLSAHRLAEASAAAGAVVVDDLCGLAARGGPELKALAGKRLRVFACRPRAVRWLLARAGVAADGEIQVVDLRREDCACCGPSPEQVGQPSAGDAWIPWFPVIDYDRCTNCRKCLGFCLFGVYGLSAAGRVEVANPASCKTNCPACARVCPAGAIIFPKYPSGPICGDDGPAAAAPAPDLCSMSGQDVYEMLRGRSEAAAKADCACSCEGGDCDCGCDEQAGECGPDCDCHKDDKK